MKLGGLSWRWLGGLALVVALALGASFWLFTAEVERLRDEELAGQLLAEARLLGYALGDTWAARDVGPIAGMVHALHNEATDVVVLAADGTVLVDTLGEQAVTAGLLAQPEVQAALREGSGASMRSGVHGTAPTRVVAVRVGSDAGELGVVWLARPRWSFATQARSFGRVIGLVGLIALATVLGIGAAITRRWTRLLRRLGRAAQGLAEGDLSVRAEVAGADEFALLAQSLNEMRRRLMLHTETIDQQRRTLEALLDQLQEGVIAADRNGRIILLNPTALRLLNIISPGAHGAGFLGRSVEECLPQHELQRLLRPGSDLAGRAGSGAADSTGGGSSGAVPTVEERHMQVEAGGAAVHLLARASELRLPPANDASETAPAGRLVVLTDVTALRHALDMQTEFVANASHELRTPLSSIRAAVETLAQLDLSKESTEAAQFIEIIHRQSSRLSALALDLLDLSRLQSPATPPRPDMLHPGAVMRELRERFADVAREKGIALEVDWQPGERRTIVANGGLLRLVLDNLVDNALQFTPSGGRVRIVCRASPACVRFEVVDTGCGIPETEQERVFERFYQVERARSGGQRGTGLGLAIVRDAVAAMRGTVRLMSRVGAGTSVTVDLPQPVGDEPSFTTT